MLLSILKTASKNKWIMSGKKQKHKLFKEIVDFLLSNLKDDDCKTENVVDVSVSKILKKQQNVEERSMSGKNESHVVQFLNAKKKAFSQRPRTGTACRPNGRSSDFIAPNLATGCELACSYCYVARHRAYGNPLEQYTNLGDIWKSVSTHHASLPPKVANQCDPTYWTYDIGESTDCLSPKNIDNTNKYIQLFQTTDAKPTFATKLAGTRGLLPLNRPRMARVRVSLAPQCVVSKVEKATSMVHKRIQGINELYDLGYEVHVNFSPVIVYKGWRDDYIKMFQELDSTVRDDVKQQLKCEVIFLTHHDGLHESNLRWIPEAEELMWKPDWQEYKTTERGDSSVLRYQYQIKSKLVDAFKLMVREHIPYCKIRYIF